MKAMVIDSKDTVAVLLGAAQPGDEITWVKNGKAMSATAVNEVPAYHKIAIEAMGEGAPVVKYGEHIGIAACDIPVGDYVHIHNVLNNREEL